MVMCGAGWADEPVEVPTDAPRGFAPAPTQRRGTGQMGLVQPITKGPFALDYAGMLYFEEGTDQATRDLRWYEHALQLQARLREGRTSDLALYADLKWLDFNDHGLRLPKSGAKFPNDLYDVGLGLLWRKRLGGERVVNARLGVSSPSDKPFSSLDEVAFHFDLDYTVPWKERWSWVFMMSYASDRELDFPLPGIALKWRPNDRLTALMGVPAFAVNWRPRPGWSVRAFYLIPRTVHAKVSCEVLRDVKLYGAFDWDSQHFFRHDRRDDSDRLQYYEKRATLGLSWQVTPRCTVDLGGGYAFGRFWFEESSYDERGESRIDLDDGPFAFLKVNVRF